jgi:hypothetical protein
MSEFFGETQKLGKEISEGVGGLSRHGLLMLL